MVVVLLIQSPCYLPARDEPLEAVTGLLVGLLSWLGSSAG